jgi:diguanylate cyclase (GGDEF)-like protein
MKRLVFGAIGTEARYLKLRLLAPGLLLAHLGIRLIFPTPTIFSDVIIFNLVGIVAAAVALSAPLFNDRLARISIALAILLWSLASLLSSWNSFQMHSIWPNFSDLAYSIFYPLVLFGILRALTVRKKFASLEVLDVIIIICGTSSMIATIFLKSAMLRFSGSQSTVFLSILYPIGDIVLLALGLAVVIVQRKALRSLLLLAGIAIFTATDLNFLWRSATTGYSFASLMDDGWLLGLILIAEALWHRGGEDELNDRLSGYAATLSLIFTALVLGVGAIRHNKIPMIALAPALITIALSFLRMALSLRSARLAITDRELARTDELTGLANRRRFLLELEALGSGEGTLLLMDLDGFKNVNDTLGHEVGDQLLKQISIRFERVLTKESLLARLGGDEFGVLVHGQPHLGLEVAQALRACVSYPFTIAGSSIKVDISIGRVINDGAPEIMRRADSAMYEAKRGALGVVLWRP